MKILVVNAGSSSLKYQLIDMSEELVLAKGNCERIGLDGHITHKNAKGEKFEADLPMPDHTRAFKVVVQWLTSGDTKVIDDLSEISAIGHRVVQGGAIFDKSVLVNEEVIRQIEELSALAPLHNPAHVQGLRACVECFGSDLPQVAVFDTGFHQTMPKHAYIFPIPYEYYEKYGVRRYGFHGTSHRYVSQLCIEKLGLGEKSKIITCHLGNGSSITAIKDGKCIDTTMGLTPLDGFIMGSRSGAVDPSAITFIMEKENLTPKQMDDILNKKSGFIGVSGVSTDSRDVEKAANEGNERAILTRYILKYQIAKYVGQFIMALGGVDAIVFTGGIGENNPFIREYVCEQLKFMGVEYDKAKNDSFIGKSGEITTPNSTVKVLVLETNEELVIARDTKGIVESL